MSSQIATIEKRFLEAWFGAPWSVRYFGSLRKLARAMYAQGRVDALDDYQRIAKRPLLVELPSAAALQHRNNLTLLAGRRHADCFQHAFKQGIPKEDLIQGFVTNRGRFVDREEGFQMMRSAGIPSASPGGYRGTHLYSEDLY